MTKTKTVVLASILAATVGTLIVLQHRNNGRLRREMVALRWEKAALLAHPQDEQPGTSNSVPDRAAASTPVSEVTNRSVAGLVTDMAASLGKSKGEKNWALAAKWARFLAQIPSDQLDQALLATLELPAGEVRSSMTLSLFHSWAGANPRAALAFATANFQGEELARSVSEAIVHWSKQDPEAALAAWRKQASDLSQRTGWGGNQHDIVRSLFDGMSHQDFQKAMDHLGSVDREYLGSALAGLGSTAAKTQEGRAFFLLQLEEVTDPKMKEAATRTFMHEWASRNDLSSARAFVESLPSEKRGIYAPEVGIASVRESSTAGAEWWLAQTANQDDRSHALFSITQEWAKKDASAAGQWLIRQGNGQETDAARMAYAERVMWHDPEVGMKWAQSISRPSLRDSTLARVWGRWLKSDAAAAERFLTQAEWSDDLVRRARNE